MKTNAQRQQKIGTWLVTLCALLLGWGMAAQVQDTAPARTAAELEALLAPIALYPDDLIAVMLPAATAPADIVLAARYNAAGGNAANLDEQAWDDSVRTLAHYPELTQWMSDNLEWTRAVGEAFRNQPADMMAAIQRLRVKAQALGNLTTTAQQKVINDQNTIMIVPANPEVIYVPQYNPQLIFLEPAPFGCSWINFGFCWNFGGWHRYDFDWRRCSVRIRERHPLWRTPVEVIHAWHPAPVAQRPATPFNRPATMPRPQQFTAAAVPLVQAPAQTQPIHKFIPPTGLPTRETPHHVDAVTKLNPAHPVRDTRHGEEHKEAPRFPAWNAGAVRTPAPTPPTLKTDRVTAPPPDPRTKPQQIAAPTKLPTPQTPPRETIVRTPTPPAAPIVKQDSGRHDIRINQNLPPIVRNNVSDQPRQEPRVMRAPIQPLPAENHVLRSAPAPMVAQPAARVEVRAAPQPADGGNAVKGDRTPGGRWGNLANRGN